MDSFHDQQQQHPPCPTWKRIKVLGRGCFATVYLAEFTDHSRNRCELLALKTARMENSSSLEKENRIIGDLNGCPEIVRCFGKKLTFEQGFSFSNLLLEYAPAGTLNDLINDDHMVLPETNVQTYTRMLLKGLRHMHAKGYVHCDLKPENILAFPSTQENDAVYQLKIADFGLAKEPGETMSSETKYKEYRFRGTPLYMSPESVKYGEICTALDIWSLGCIVVHMITGKPPWHGRSAFSDIEVLIYALDFHEMSPITPRHMSESGIDFLSKCFTSDPRERWSAEMLLQHPYVNGHPKQAD